MRKKVGFLLNGPRFLCVALLLLTGLIFLPVNHAQAAITLVDHFTDPQLPGISVTQANPHVVQSQAGVMMGGIRWLDLLWLAGPNADRASVGPAVNPHNLFFSCDTQTSGNLLVTWNGSATYATAALAKNLQALGDRFVVQGVSTDVGVLNGGQLRVYTDATHFSVATLVIPQLITPPGLAITVLFSAFVGSVDWTNVNRIEMFLPGVPDLDLTIDDVVIECDIPPPTISQFYANPQQLTAAPPQTVQLCYQVSNAGTILTITDTTHGGVVVGPVAATGALVCVPNIPVSSVPTTFSLYAANGCAPATAPNPVTTTVTFNPPPPGKVPGLTELGMIILSLILAISAIVFLRKRNSIG